MAKVILLLKKPECKPVSGQTETVYKTAPRASQYNMTKPIQITGDGKYSGCAGKNRVLARGDLPAETPELAWRSRACEGVR